MKKVKWFTSFLKERDWLESMAEQGWLLTDMTLGIIYHFKEIEPTKKVYEIERFGVSANPGKHELTARKMALDIAQQSGWQVVTHDEDMNYYFVKDKVFDESDEFYDDETRKERAEKYLKRYSQEQPKMLLGMLFIMSIVYFLLLFVETKYGSFSIGLWILFFSVLVISLGIVLFYMGWGQRMYRELSLSREQWEKEKTFAVKNDFSNTGKMLEFLNGKSNDGLALTDYKQGKFLFEEDSTSYEYFADTKSALKRRMKKQGKKFRNEAKDWDFQSPKWYELSIAEAESKGMELVCVIDREILVYRKNCGEQDNGHDIMLMTEDEPMGMAQKIKNSGWFWIACFLIGVVAGFISAFVKDFV